MTCRNPSVAVLLAAYNGTLYLSEQLDSILSQVGVNITVFVSVDVSSDGTEMLVESYARKDKRVRILPYGEHFGGAAPNFFRLINDVDFSAFDYISFADQDDIWLPHKLLRAHEVLILNSSAAYSSDVLAYWPNGRYVLIRKSQSQVKWDYLFEAAGPGCTYVMTNKLALDIKKAIYENRQNVNMLGLHDWFCYAFARANGYKWHIDSTPSMRYRQHASNQVGVNLGWKAFEHRFSKITSGWAIKQSALIAELVGKKEDLFVKSWSNLNKLGFLKLAFSANKCRRKLSDQCLFFFSCLLMAIVVKNSDNDLS